MATILIIADDPTTQELLAVLLHLAGYHVRTAAHGAEALVHLQHPVDVVLGDVHLPGPDATAFYQSLRTDPAYRTLPCIFISAIAPRWTPGDPHVAVLAKPLRPDHLLTTIARMITHTPHERDGA